MRQAKEAGEAGTAVGASIGVGIIVVCRFFVDGILGILWLVTRPKARPCPVCGTRVKEGVTICPKCGHDFRAAVGGAPPPIPPAPA
jgi:zinc-ribbon domain